MRILAIRGANLASLAAPFDIDLDGGPLGATGIFAITGETGAGKSTILDALCLALYGRFPRVSAGRNEDVPDPGGQAINSGDPRAILRRGAGEGFAEVDFLGRDGVAYRARWTVYRARNRANGRLQAETRILSRIEDGAAVATGKTAVNEAVVARTDLTFDQFRRTVVLAQGEFDAFLLAGEGDRADLLEKITGTQVYTEISKRVRAGADERRAAFAILVARHDAIGLLDVAERRERTAERDVIDAAMPALATEHGSHLTALDHARRSAAAEARFAEAAVLVEQAASAVRDGRDDAVRLAEIEAVEPSRRPADAMTAAEAELAAAEGVLETAVADVDATGAALAEVRTGLATARAADEAGEADYRGFTPTWGAAGVLDARIVELAREADAATAGAKDATANLDGARARRCDLDKAYDALSASRDETARRIVADAAMAPLADGAAEIAGLFEKRTALALERDAALVALADAET
ncbi:AAA family ATPase, partial [Methylobacterium sp. WL19]